MSPEDAQPLFAPPGGAQTGSAGRHAATSGDSDGAYTPAGAPAHAATGTTTHSAGGAPLRGSAATARGPGASRSPYDAPAWPASPAPAPGAAPAAASPLASDAGSSPLASDAAAPPPLAPYGAPLAPDAAASPTDLPPQTWVEPRRARSGRSRRAVRSVAAAVVVLVVAAVGAVGGIFAERHLTQRPSVSIVVAGTDGGSGSAAGTDEPRAVGSVADVAATVLPSVVSFRVVGSEGESTGSGFVLSADGYLLTNNHVVEPAVTAGGAGSVLVLLADGSQASGTVVGRTASYDLAVVKIDRTGLVPLTLGDSDDLVVGEPVVAVGAPLGLTGTVTTGIVSALNRPVAAGGGETTAFINAVQTDAAINPGNSGGPLVNGAGQVVGINSAIAQPPGAVRAAGSIGLGFAIPSNQARRTATELIETGRATYPIIGVMLDTTYDGEGVRVVLEAQGGTPPVTPDSPASRAGIRAGDVIVAIDGRPVTQPDELVVAIRAKAPGDAVTLTLREGGRERDVRMVLDEAVSS